MSARMKNCVAVGKPRAFVDFVLNLLESNNHIKVSKYIDGQSHVWDVSARCVGRSSRRNKPMRWRHDGKTDRWRRRDCADDDIERNSEDQHSLKVPGRIKLEALEKYLVAFNTALSKQSFTRLYIDAFAGTGRCEIKVDGERKSIDGSRTQGIDGRPIVPQVYASSNCARRTAALNALGSEFPGKAIEVIQSDANAALKTLCSQHQRNSERPGYFSIRSECTLNGRLWK